MFSSNLFYTKKALESIQLFIRTPPSAYAHANAHDNKIDTNQLKIENSKQVIQFPVRFTNRKQSGKAIRFYEKYMSPKIFKQLFTDTVLAISKLSKNQVAIPKQAQIMQPTLLKKMRREMSINKLALDIESVEIKSTDILAHCLFKGAFMHRELNMPAQCYSVEVVNEKSVVFRMRNKITNSHHIELLSYKKQLFNANDYRLEKYYLDSYENFVKNEKLARLLVEVNAVIVGKLTTREGRQIKLPIEANSPVTTHLMQLQKIDVPGRSEREKCLVTDIDYYMQGNPFTS